MTESSLPWSGTTDPDAGPYTDDQWSDWQRIYFTGTRVAQGVVPGYGNGLSATGAVSPVTVNPGAAIVDGKFYESDAAENIVIPTPAGATRIDVIVLRKSWANQEVRLTRVVGVEGGGVPAITQNDGVTWDLPLWQASITVGGVITLTDRRRLAMAAIAQRPICQGRLTLTSGTPITTADVSAATSIYFTPYKGDLVSLWNGSYGGWIDYNFAELTLTVPNTSTQMYDVFLYDAGEGVLTLEAVAWTNDTTRNVALSAQDGMYIKSTDSRLYLGSFRTGAVAGQVDDTDIYRGLYNYFNRVPRRLARHDSTNSWTYNAEAWRQANASALNQVEVVQGINEEPVRLTVTCSSDAANLCNTADTVGIALDATNTNHAQVVSAGGDGSAGAGIRAPMMAEYIGYPGVGFHYYAWVEWAGKAATNSTFYGDGGGTYVRSGMVGHIMG